MKDIEIKELLCFYETISAKRCSGDELKPFRDYYLYRTYETIEGEIVDIIHEPMTTISGKVAQEWERLREKWLLNNPEPYFPQTQLEIAIAEALKDF